jgi:hypothetical protein
VFLMDPRVGRAFSLRTASALRNTSLFISSFNDPALPLAYHPLTLESTGIGSSGNDCGSFLRNMG